MSKLIISHALYDNVNVIFRASRSSKRKAEDQAECTQKKTAVVRIFINILILSMYYTVCAFWGKSIYDIVMFIFTAGLQV